MAEPSAMKYDVELFDPPPCEELICTVCRCIFSDPVECPCRHVFCRSCIETWLATSSNCPNCRKRATKDTLKPVLPLVKNLIGKLMMKCENQEKGCMDKIPMETYESHKKVCDHETVTCKNGDGECKEQRLRKDMGKHEQKECIYRLVRCKKDCELSLPSNMIKKHSCMEELKKRLKAMETICSLYKELCTELEELKKKQAELIQRLSEPTNRRFLHRMDDYFPQLNDGEAVAVNLRDWLNNPPGPNQAIQENLTGSFQTLIDRANSVLSSMRSQFSGLNQPPQEPNPPNMDPLHVDVNLWSDEEDPPSSPLPLAPWRRHMIRLLPDSSNSDDVDYIPESDSTLSSGSSLEVISTMRTRGLERRMSEESERGRLRNRSRIRQTTDRSRSSSSSRESDSRGRDDWELSGNQGRDDWDWFGDQGNWEQSGDQGNWEQSSDQGRGENRSESQVRRRRNNETTGRNKRQKLGNTVTTNPDQPSTSSTRTLDQPSTSSTRTLDQPSTSSTRTLTQPSTSSGRRNTVSEGSRTRSRRKKKNVSSNPGSRNGVSRSNTQGASQAGTREGTSQGAAASRNSRPTSEDRFNSLIGQSQSSLLRDSRDPDSLAEWSPADSSLDDFNDLLEEEQEEYEVQVPVSTYELLERYGDDSSDSDWTPMAR